jgi:hypothetical protein
MPVNARAIIPGDDPGDQELSERRGFYCATTLASFQA